MAIQKEREEEDKVSMGLTGGSHHLLFIYLLIGLTRLPCELKTNLHIKIPATSAPHLRKNQVRLDLGG